jgi:NodT family efflux transporter outer membrane factor (OMF) lipoprotein
LNQNDLQHWQQSNVKNETELEVKMISHQRIALLLLLSLTVIASGCMVGPNYHPPKTKVPENYGELNASQSTKSTTNGSEPKLANWWTTFDDPTLNSLIERAVKANPDLRIAQARVREARAERGIVAADLYPQINVGGSYTRQRISEGSFTGAPSGAIQVEGDLYQVGFDASWEIDLFGGKRRNIEAANADLAAAVEDRRDVLITLLSEVARNYVELRASQRQIKIAQANVQAQQETFEITKIRFDAGLVSDLDVQRSQAQVQTTAATIPTLETAARQSMHLLSVLLGQEPTALVQELSVETPIPSTPPEVPVGLPSELLRRRPDVRRAERQLASATARIGVATADLFPKFSLTGILGLSSTKVGNLTNSGNTFYSIIPGVSWPILDFGRIKNNIAVQGAREEQAAVAYEQAVLISLQDVEDVLVAFSQEQTRRETLITALEANRRAVDLSNQLYQQGLTDFISVLQAQRDLYASEDALVQSDRNVSSNLVALYKALGGGWEIEEIAVDTPAFGKPGERTIDVTTSKMQR